MDMVVSSSLKRKSSDYSHYGLGSKTKLKETKSDFLSALKSSNVNDNEGNSSPAKPDDKYGFMDMVVSRKLKIKSSDYSRETHDSEDAPTKFSGSKDQGRFGQVHLNSQEHMDFSKDNDSGIHITRREGEEGFLQSRIIHSLQTKCTQEIPESHQKAPE